MPTFKANLHNLILILLIVNAGITTPSASHAAVEAVVIGSWCTGSSDPCDAAFRVNLSTGQRTLLSAYTTEDHQRVIDEFNTNTSSELTRNRGSYGWTDIAISPAGQIFFIATHSGYQNSTDVSEIYAIDPANGSRRFLMASNNDAYGFLQISTLEAPNNNKLLVTATARRTSRAIPAANGIFNIDLGSGLITLLSDPGQSSQGLPFDNLLGIDPTGRILVESRTNGTDYSILQVDASSGVRTEVARFPGAGFFECRPLEYGSAIDASGKIYCIRYDLYSFDAISNIGPTKVSDLYNYGQGREIGYPVDMVLSFSNQVLILDRGDGHNRLGGIYAVDLNTGTQRKVSDFDNAEQGPLIYYPRKITTGDLPTFVGNDNSNGGNNDNTGGSTGGNNENSGGNTQNTSVTPSQFGLGTAVTLNGQGFGATKGKLLVGKKTAKLKSWTDASIVFTPPALKAGNYPVRLRTKRGRAINVTVPDVTVLAPALSELSTTSAKTGDTVTITGNALGTIKPKAYFITGKKKIRVTVLKGFNDISAQVKIPKLKAGDYQVVVTNPAGSSNALTLQVNSLQDSVDNMPPIVPAPGNTSIDESVSAEIGQKVYERAFGRGCGTCHDIPSNPQLSANIKASSLDRARFEKIIREGKGGMPKAIDEIMKQRAVAAAGYDEKQALDALYKYLRDK